MLSTFCETQGILAQAQEGSREKRNTLRQLTRVTNTIEDANVSGRELHGLYVDFENAYGSVDHNKLLHTTQYLGIPEDLTQVVRDVLAGEIDDFNKVIGGATKNMQGLPRNGTPNIFTTQEKEKFGLGMVPLQAVYAQSIWSGLLEAMHSEEDRGAVQHYASGDGGDAQAAPNPCTKDNGTAEGGDQKKI
eukprot:gene34473-biopygen31024